jgi:hypothetical protein
VTKELDSIEALIRADDRAELLKMVGEYHHRRCDAAARLVRLTSA